MTPAQMRRFDEEGFFVLENVIPGSDLETLRAELTRFIARTEEAMDTAGTDVLGLNHCGRRYFIGNRHAEAEGRLEGFLFGDLVAEICRATLGDDAHLFVEQFVVKMADVGSWRRWGPRWRSDINVVPALAQAVIPFLDS